MPGGGGGSIHAMITSLRENKKLLRKKTFFLREDIAELHRAEHHEPLQFKEANKEVLQQIKQKHGLRKRLTGLLAFAIVLLTAGISLYFVFVNQPKQPKISNSQKAEKLVLFNQKIVKKEK